MYRHPQILRVIANAVRWAAPRRPVSVPKSVQDVKPKVPIAGFVPKPESPA